MPAGRAVAGWRWALGWFLGLTCWSAAPVQGQGLAPLPSLDPGGFASFASTRAPGPWLLDAALSFSYARAPLGRVDSVARHQLASWVGVRLGLGGRVGLSLQQPFSLWTQERTFGDGVGDGLFAGSVRVWGAATDSRGDTQEGAALSLDGGVSLPWGRESTGFSRAGPRVSAGATLDMRAFGLGVALRAHYGHDSAELEPATGRNRLGLVLGMQFPLSLLSRPAPEALEEHFVLELDLYTDPTTPFSGASTALPLRGMWRLRFVDWSFALGGEAALVRALDTPRGRVFLSLHFSPRVRDGDLDGVSDSRDVCPALAEDPDGFQDQDGCPEPDNDEDGVADEDDLCPLVAADYDQDEDEDGCTDPK